MNGRMELRKSILEDSGVYNQRDRTVRVDQLKEDRAVRSLKVLVLRKYPPRLVSSRKWTGWVAAACGRDDTGVVGLVLWDKQIDWVATGDVVLIQNGWCKRRMGGRVVSTGRSGRLSVAGIQSL